MYAVYIQMPYFNNSTLIRLLLREQSGQGPYCLGFRLQKYISKFVAHILVSQVHKQICSLYTGFSRT